jgi:hypothetical protein
MQNLLKLILSRQEVHTGRMLFCLSPLLVFLLFLGQAESCPPMFVQRQQQRAGFFADMHSTIPAVNGDWYPFLNGKNTFTPIKESQLIESSACLSRHLLSLDSFPPL